MKRLSIIFALLIATPVVLSAAMCSSCRSGHHRGNSGYSTNHSQQAFNQKTFRNYKNVNSDYYASTFDSRTLNDIRDRLDRRNPNWNNRNVFVFVEYGKIVLNGKVDTQQEKQEIEEIANSANGAKIVVNKIDVRY